LVTAYRIDTSQSDFKGEVFDVGSTNNRAEIIDLNLEAGKFYILEIVADADTLDLTTGSAPVLKKLTTVMSPAILDSGSPIYATPMTTLAVELAISNADSSSGAFSGNDDGVTSASEFTSALDAAAGQVKSFLGFGMNQNIDIFTAAPLVNNETTSQLDLLQVAEYRTAIEVITALTVALNDEIESQNPTAISTPDLILDAIAADITDGRIDGKASGSPILALNDIVDLKNSVEIDPITLTIPGTSIPISSIQSLLDSETSVTGTTTDTSALIDGRIEISVGSLNFIADSDNDGASDLIDAFPTDPLRIFVGDGSNVGETGIFGGSQWNDGSIFE